MSQTKQHAAANGPSCVELIQLLSPLIQRSYALDAEICDEARSKQATCRRELDICTARIAAIEDLILASQPLTLEDAAAQLILIYSWIDAGTESAWEKAERGLLASLSRVLSISDFRLDQTIKDFYIGNLDIAVS